MNSINSNRQIVIKRKGDVRGRLVSLLCNLPLVIIATILVAIPSIVVPITSRPWHGLKGLIGVIGGFVAFAVYVLLFDRRRMSNTWQTVKSTPLHWYMFLLIWSSASLFWTRSQTFSGLGVVELLSGAMVLVIVSTTVRTEHDLEWIVASILGASCILGIGGLLSVGQGGTGIFSSDGSNSFTVGTFHDHQLFGSLCMILFPVVLSIAISPIKPVYRYTAQFGSCLCAVALLFSQHRSAWIAELFALIVFAALYFSARRSFVHVAKRKGSDKRKKQIVPYAILGLGAIVALIFLVPDSSAITKRFTTLTTTVVSGKDRSLDWRLRTWRGEIRMIERRPWFGNGIGSYPALQYRFTGVGQPRSIVEGIGPTIEDEAHDSYLQVSADLGIPGLILWLSALGSTILYGVLSLKRVATGSVRWYLLIGCIAAVAGQSVDAIGSPSWQFPDIMFYYWVIAGLLISVANAGSARMSNDTGQTRFVESFGILKTIVVILVAALLIYESLTKAVYFPMPKL